MAHTVLNTAPVWMVGHVIQERDSASVLRGGLGETAPNVCIFPTPTPFATCPWWIKICLLSLRCDFHRSDDSELWCHRFFTTSLVGKLVPPSRSIRCKIKTNCLLVTHVFPRSRSFARFRSDFSLAPLVFTFVLTCCCECILAELYRSKIAIETHNVTWITRFQSVFHLRLVYVSDRMSYGAIWLWMFAPLLMR